MADQDREHDDANLDMKEEKSKEELGGDEEPSSPDVAAPDEEKAAPPAPPAGPPGGPPPDGGLAAWSIVLGSWFLYFNTWGLLNTFGVFQTYYESGQLFKSNSSDIAWIGSIQALMVLLVGCVTGPVYDRGYLRSLLIFGTFWVVFGHMMLSLSTELYQALLAQGFAVGIGAGCLFVPAVALMPQWFSSRLGMAIGLAASGSSTGGIIYPIMFYKLIPQVGFPWAVRILGFTILATLLVPLTLMRFRVKPGKVRSLIDVTAFTDWPFVVFVIGSMIGFIGLYVGFFYTSFYGEATGYTNEALSFYLVPILNAGSVLGRTLPNILSDKIGPLNVITPGAYMVGVVLLCYMAVMNLGGMVVVALFFGFFSGIFIGLPPVIFVVLTKDKSKIGTRIGMGFAIVAFGVLAGGPGGGAIIGADSKNLHWKSVWTYGGVMAMGAAVVFTILRFWRAGGKLMVKV